MKKAVSSPASTYSGQRVEPRRRAGATTTAVDAAMSVQKPAIGCSHVSPSLNHLRLLVLHPQRAQIDAGVDEREQHDQQRIAGGDTHVVIVAIPGKGLTGEDRQVAASEIGRASCR